MCDRTAHSLSGDHFGWGENCLLLLFHEIHNFVLRSHCQTPPAPPPPTEWIEPMLIGRLYIKVTSRSLEMTGAHFISSLTELPARPPLARPLTVLPHVRVYVA